MKAYPTVNDLPDDVRARFSGDALEVYRAAYNISYAYDGRGPFVAAHEAEAAVREVSVPLLHEPRDWIRAGFIYTAIGGVFGGCAAHTSTNSPLHCSQPSECSESTHSFAGMTRRSTHNTGCNARQTCSTRTATR